MARVLSVVAPRIATIDQSHIADQPDNDRENLSFLNGTCPSHRAWKAIPEPLIIKLPHATR
jgi:hypothetical protein